MFGLTIVQSLVVEGARNAIQQITQYSADKNLLHYQLGRDLSIQ